MPLAQRKVAAGDFFNKLKKNAAAIVDEESGVMADEMQYRLRHRLSLEGQGSGRYPKQENKSPSQGDNSFKAWQVQKRKNGEYWVVNYHENTSGFQYVNILLTGKGWSPRVMLGDWKKLVVGPNGGIFSTQMPQGIDPWLKNRREELKRRMKAKLSGNSVKRKAYQYA